jgi:hypothetical protein
VIDELYGSGLNKDFIKWYNAGKVSLKAGDLDMSDMFLAPLSRMGRYYAFLKNLERKTDKESIDFPVLEKVFVCLFLNFFCLFLNFVCLFVCVFC